MCDCDLYEDPELYDLLFPAANNMTSSRFYVDEAGKRGGRVLELGCGTGRLTVSIAENGSDIVGADLSASMLAAARAKAAAAGVDAAFVQADMRHFDLGGPF